jgi:hypothetical protein
MSNIPKHISELLDLLGSKSNYLRFEFLDANVNPANVSRLAAQIKETAQKVDNFFNGESTRVTTTSQWQFTKQKQIRSIREHKFVEIAKIALLQSTGQHTRSAIIETLQLAVKRANEFNFKHTTPKGELQLSICPALIPNQILVYRPHGESALFKIELIGEVPISTN